MALDDASALAGRHCEQFRLVEQLAAADSANVFRAVDSETQSSVALTLFPTALSASASLLARVRDEVRRTNALKHPHLLPVAYVSAAEGRLFGVTRILEQSLAARLRDSGALAPDVAARLIGDVAWAVYALHSIGLLHGEITPANIWLDEHGVPQLLDLGIGRAFAEQQRRERRSGVRRLLRKGPPAPAPAPYAAPELRRSGCIGIRSDIYALGAVLHAVLTGQPPPAHVGTEHPTKAAAPDGSAMRAASLRAALAHLDPTVADIAALQTIVQSALADDPAQRFADARVLAVALHAAATPPVVPVVTPSLPETLAGVRHVRTVPLREVLPGDLLARAMDDFAASDAPNPAPTAPAEVAYMDDVALVNAHEAASAATPVPTPATPPATAAASDTPASATSPTLPA